MHLLGLLNFTSFVSTAGYSAVFVLCLLQSCCVPTSSELTLGFAGVLAAEGKLSLAGVVVVGVAGEVVGAYIAWLLGRYAGRSVVGRFGRYLLLTHRDLDRAEAWYERHQRFGVLSSRLPPGRPQLRGTAGRHRRGAGWAVRVPHCRGFAPLGRRLGRHRLRRGLPVARHRLGGRRHRVRAHGGGSGVHHPRRVPPLPELQRGDLGGPGGATLDHTTRVRAPRSEARADSLASRPGRLVAPFRPGTRGRRHGPMGGRLVRAAAHPSFPGRPCPHLRRLDRQLVGATDCPHPMAWEAAVLRGKTDTATHVEPLFDEENEGVESNSRLTAMLGAVLLVLLAVEGLTILHIGPLLTIHVVVGMVLVPVVSLKIGSTTWRFARYYLGSPEYRRKGPSPAALRLLGPLVVVSTVTVVASGIALLLAPTSLRNELLLIHRVTFVLWFVAMVVHVLGHLLDVARLAPRDFYRRTRRQVRGASMRQWAIVSAVCIGILLAVLVAPQVATWLHEGVPAHKAAGTRTIVVPSDPSSGHT